MSRSEVGYDEGARWLLSDSQIIGRVQKGQHKQGILLTLKMPHGDDCVAVVEKMNAASMTQFCELARGEYNAWKGEQVAKAERTGRDSEQSRSEPEAVIPKAQASVAVNPLDPESIRAEVTELSAAQDFYRRKLMEVNKEIEQWTSILGVLNAPTDVTETMPSVQRTESPERRKGDPLDHPSCEEQLQSEGSNCSESIDTELGAASPPPYTVGSKED